MLVFTPQSPQPLVWTPVVTYTTWQAPLPPAAVVPVVPVQQVVPLVPVQQQQQQILAWPQPSYTIHYHR
ncbi:hypothetical protein DL766_001736 [Monosporascus sp. MC13-8B]|uniref:Uncharacterized protein n=1 Tax=Monosporascus cannonballus TaxID=155416 RepID=A0ABY0GV70_9PEZI|nr:hypothetical protein DL762_008890 [Monosporascus cannonballus]RYO95224.1 hypothetical protein DL763_003792 [Monosporascus cannonballus]RYP36858.1 hypothetical protein DL766_001736 [Monosporascus sp. MC13-8B]